MASKKSGVVEYLCKNALPNADLCEVRVDKIKYDVGYCNSSPARGIVGVYNPEKETPILLNYREDDKCLHLVDGYKRLMNAKNKNAKTIKAYVYHGIDSQQEYSMQLQENCKTTLGLVTVFKLALKNNEEWAVNLKAAFDQYKFTTCLNCPRECADIKCLKVFVVAYNRGGIELVENMLYVMSFAWRDSGRLQDDARESSVLSGLREYLLNTHAHVEDVAHYVEGWAKEFCERVKDKYIVVNRNTCHMMFNMIEGEATGGLKLVA